LKEDETGVATFAASDPDGDMLTYEVVSVPTKGRIEVSGNKLYYYPDADWFGEIKVTYRARDVEGAESNVATITITVTPVNDPPVAQPKSLAMDEDTSGSVTLTATDIDSPAPTVFQVVTQPNASHGTATVRGATLTFTPVKDWSGTATLTYRAQDSSGAWSEPATVTITVRPVNDAPIAQTKFLTIDEDTSGTITLTATDVDSPAPTVFQIVSPPNSTHGSAAISGSTLIFKPVDNWNGSSYLTYRAQDSSGAWSPSATISITVRPVNDVPVAANGVLTIDEDTVGEMILGVTDVDLFFEGDSHSWSIVSAPNMAHGSASLIGNNLTFTPAKDWYGTTSLTYKIRDSKNADSNTAAITITVRPVNDAPIAQAFNLTIDEDIPGSVTLLATDVDSVQPFTFEIVSSPILAHGSVSLQGDKLTFNPTKDWNGDTSVSYRVKDSEGSWSTAALVQITVRPVNDQPVKSAKIIIRTIESMPVIVRGAVSK